MLNYQVGQTMRLKNSRENAAFLSELWDAGYYCNYRSDNNGNLLIHIYAHLSPTTRDADGFFIEDDALWEHLEYETEMAFGVKEPRRFFMTNEERQDSENCLQFVQGRWNNETYWGDDKLYLYPGLLLYSNLEQAIKTVIPDFDIYTPGVVICKTDESYPRRIPEQNWVEVDVVTCAAPNLRQVPGNIYNPDEGEPVAIDAAKLYDIHVSRARHILSVAAYKGMDTVVLGAFGCGAFQNDPAVVAEAYRDVLAEMKGQFEYIEFAIYCRAYETANYDAFRATLK